MDPSQISLSTAAHGGHKNRHQFSKPHRNTAITSCPVIISSYYTFILCFLFNLHGFWIRTSEPQQSVTPHECTVLKLNNEVRRFMCLAREQLHSPPLPSSRRLRCCRLLRGQSNSPNSDLAKEHSVDRSCWCVIGRD